MLSNLGALQTDYSSDACDISSEFYGPCLENSNQYDRITGFFSSTAFLVAWQALGKFVLGNQGQIRIVCSPKLSEQDAGGLLYGYQARDEEALAAELGNEMRRLLESAPTRRTAELMAALIAAGRLDVKLARVSGNAALSTKRMFHDKVGLFRDSHGNAVGFRGSMNESLLGISPGGNVESIDVWPLWAGGRDAQRVQNAQERFERLWTGNIPGVEVLELPGTAREAIEQVAEGVDMEEILYLLATGRIGRTSNNASHALDGMELRPHQMEAVEAWEGKSRKTLLEHATGSGKTRTGLYCMRVAQRDGLTPVVLVPSQILLEQWAREVKEILGCRVVLCGGGNERWGPQRLVRAAIEAGSSDRPVAVIAVMNSAATPDFVSQVRPLGKKVFIVADEVHRLGSLKFRSIMAKINAIARLGLSATPERAGDEAGTRAIMDYFGGVGHSYSLSQAVQDGILVPYTYDAVWVGFADSEYERWQVLTDEIKKLYAMLQGARPPADCEERMRRKLIERARVAKNAVRKIDKCAQLVSENYVPDCGQRWLIYCDNQVQLRAVRGALTRAGVPSWEYHRQMAGDATATLKLFEDIGGVIVSIRCLDEGVDIPSATHALILASSRNPREFIQRRGRVLRRSPGKSTATIYDVLVLPDTLDAEDPTKTLAMGELARAMNFAESALGPSASAKLRRRWVELGLPTEGSEYFKPQGFEADEETESEGVA
ncbi:DEAD/DEAH box helicase family protein [Streptomyces sp. NPDC054933]